MSFSITEAFVRQFKGNVTHLAQQQGSLLRNTLRVEDITGNKVAFERLAASAAVKRTTRHADTPLIDVVHSRRWATPVDYDWADLIDNLDKVKLLVSMESEYAINGANAIGKAMDNEIISAFTAAAETGPNGGTTTAFDTAQFQVAAQSADMTLAKLIEASKRMDKGPVPKTDRYIVLSPDQLEALLNTTTVTSVDFNTVKALVRGEIDSFLGFKFIVSTLLPKTGNIRSCFAWHKNCMGLALNKDITTRINERDSKNYATQVYLCASLGAVRIDDAGVIEILCDESVA